MSMLESFEKQLKAKADQQLDDSASFVWEDLSKAIRPEKKKRRFIFWWIFGAIIMAGGALCLINWNNISIEKKKSILSNVEENAYSNNSKNSTQNKINSTEEIDIVSKKNILTVPQIKSSVSHAQRSISSYNTSKFTDNNIRNNRKSNLLIQEHNVSSNYFNKNSRNQVEKTSSISENQTKSSNEKELIDVSQIGSEVTIKNVEYNLNRIALKTLMPLITLNTELLLIDSPIKIFEKEPKCPRFGKRKTSFFAEIEGLAGYPLKSLDSKTEALKLYDLRKETERSWFSWGGDFHVGIIFREQYSLSSGIEFVQLKEKFDYAKTEILDLVFHENPVTGEITGPFVIKGSRTTFGEITHSMIDIPLNFGYQTHTDKWNFGITAGPVFNFSLTSRGKIMTDVDKIGFLQDEDIYTNSLKLGLQGGIYISKKLGSKLSLYAKPGFKYFFNSWNKDSYPIDTKLQQVNLAIGLRLNI